MPLDRCPDPSRAGWLNCKGAVASAGHIPRKSGKLSNKPTGTDTDTSITVVRGTDALRWTTDMGISTSA